MDSLLAMCTLLDKTKERDARKQEARSGILARASKTAQIP